MAVIPPDIDDKTLESLGWREMSGGFGFTELAGPWWVRSTDSGRVMGLRLAEQHGNQNVGTVHGGMVMTLADNGLGAAVTHAIDGLHCVTISLQTHFVSAAKVGEFMYCEGEVVRRTNSLVFVRGLILSGDRTVASAEGIWKVIEAR